MTRNRFLILFIAVVFVGGWLAKGQLHSLGAEIGSAKSEAAKTLYLLETSFNPLLVTQAEVGKEKIVALTFDDGPDPRFTPQVLEILKKYNVKATFFVVGQSSLTYPDLIRKEIADGNEVENHTFTHPDLKQDNDIQTKDEILKCQQVILNLTGKRPHYFRPPKGLFTNETLSTATKMNYRLILWTVCVEHSRAKTPEEMAARVIKAARPGAIILAHDGRLDRSRTMEALPLVIEGYQKQGYQFVTLDELISVDNKTLH